MRCALVPLLAIAACGGDGGGSAGGGGSGGSGARDGLFTAAVTDVRVEVDYETGAVPHTEAVLGFGDPWSLFLTNLEALFAAHPKTLDVDTTLADMEDVGDLAAEDFTSGDLLDLAGLHRQGADSESRRSFYVVFVDGYFADESGRRDTVLGVSIGDSGVVGLFKPVIESTSLPERVEQTTLVHEVGHAVGLVANGVAAVTASHHDEAHGAHCANSDCVMYWLNESGSDVVGYVAQNVLADDVVLFDSDCLADVEAAAQ